jgi:hypothetical protein
VKLYFIVEEVTSCDKQVGSPLHLIHAAVSDTTTRQAANKEFRASIKRLTKIFSGQNVLLEVQIQRNNRVIRRATLRWERIIKEQLILLKSGRGWVRESDWLDKKKDFNPAKGILRKYLHRESRGSVVD